MALTKRNVIVGAARLYVGPAGTTRPDPVAGTNYTTTMDAAADWVDVGYTTDGLEVATDPTFDDITADQSMDAVRIFKSGMSLSVSTTLLEATLENLLIAWGQADSTLAAAAGETGTLMGIEAGNLGDAPIARGLIAIGNAVELAAGGNRFGQRVYHLYNVLSVEGSTYNMSRTDASTIPVTFRALPDDASGLYGTIRDRLGTDGYGTPAV